jgi:hypothetical protein
MLPEELLLFLVQSHVQLWVGFTLFHVPVDEWEADALAGVCVGRDWDVHVGL